MSTNAEWATKAWVVLVMIADRRGTIQYEQLAEAIGYRGVWGHTGHILNLIQDYCEAQDLPALTSLVVGKRTGRPTRVSVEDVDAEREKVYAHLWHRMLPPTPNDLDRAAESELAQDG